MRPAVSRHRPLHVTLRVLAGVPSLRGCRLFRQLRSAFSRARQRLGARLANYSVQGNHVHLIVEAESKEALSRAIQGLSIRIARAVNRVHARRGRVFAERYHARQLGTPLEVRRALVYVLFNERRHLAESGLSLPPWWLDDRSSAAEFHGFCPLPGIPPPQLCPYETTVPPRSFLLSTGWQRHGLIQLDEMPGDARSRRVPGDARSRRR